MSSSCFSYSFSSCFSFYKAVRCRIMHINSGIFSQSRSRDPALKFWSPCSLNCSLWLERKLYMLTLFRQLQSYNHADENESLFTFSLWCVFHLSFFLLEGRRHECGQQQDSEDPQLHGCTELVQLQRSEDCERKCAAFILFDEVCFAFYFHGSDTDNYRFHTGRWC